MSLRFYRRRNIFPGLGLELSRSGPALSVGMRGAHVTVGRHGIRRTVGVPGSGLFYTSYSGRHSGFHSAAGQDQPLSREEQGAADHAAELLLLAAIAICLLLATIIVGGILALVML